MPQQDIATKVKIWLFPSLVTILGTLIWRDVSEMKSDIKALLAQSNIDKTRIDNLERVIYNTDKTAFIKESSKDKEEEHPKLSMYKDIVLNNTDRKKKLNVFLKRTYV